MYVIFYAWPSLTSTKVLVQTMSGTEVLRIMLATITCGAVLPAALAVLVYLLAELVQRYSLQFYVLEVLACLLACYPCTTYARK